MDNASTTLSIILSAQDKVSAVFGAIGDKIKDMAGVSDDSAKKLENLGGAADATSAKFKTVGAIASGALAVGLVAVGANSVKAAASFQQMTSTLVTTAGESEKNIDSIRSGILQLSSQTGTSVDQMSKAMYTIESAGYHGANGLTILKAAAQGAKTENADLGKVADAVTSAMRDYNAPANQAATITSKLVAAVGAGKANFEDFAGSLHAVLPIASAAHISMNDILGDMASMTVHGISAEQASNNLANAIRTMQSPSQSAQQYLAQLGITASDLSDHLSTKGLSGTLEEVSNAIMQHMGPSGKVLIDSFNQSKTAAADAQSMITKMPASLQKLAQQYLAGSISAKDWRTDTRNLSAEQSNLANQFASTANNASGFNNLLKSGSPTALSYSQALQKATGNATTMNVALMLTGENAAYTANAVKKVGEAHAEAGNNVAGWSLIQKNFNQQLNEAQQSLKNTGIAIGSGLLPAVTTMAKVIVAVIEPLAEFASKHEKLVGILLASVAAFAAVIAITLTISLAFKKVNDAFEILSKSFLTNPIVLVAMAIALVAYEVITHWDTVKGWFGGFFDWIKGVFNSAIAPLSDVWHHISDAAKDAFAVIEKAFGDVAAFVGRNAKTFETIGIIIGVIVGPALVKMGIQAVVSGAQMAASAAVSGAAWVANAARASFAWLTQTLPGLIAGGAKAGAEGAAGAAKAGVAWVIEATKTAASWAVTFAQFAAGMVKMVAEFLVQAARMAAGWLLAMGPIGLLVAVVAGVVALIMLNWNKVGPFFTKLWTDIVNFVKAHWKLIVDVLLGPIGIVMTNWGKITAFFNKLWTDVENFVKQHWKLIVDIMLGALGLVITNWSTITKFFGQLLQGVEAVFTTVKNFIVNFFRNEWQGMVNIWNGLVNFFTNIWNGMKNVFNTLRNFIVDIFRNEWNGLTNIWNGVTGFFSGLWSGIKNGLKDIPGIFSAPFKSAFDAIADLWNGTVGKLHFSAPSWVPGIGGKGFSMPTLPHLATGTNFFSGGAALVGEQGPEIVVLPTGSQVIPNQQSSQILNGTGGTSQGGGTTNLSITVNVGAYAGQPGEIDKLGTVLWQSFQRIARQHGLANALPNIGVRPT